MEQKHLVMSALGAVGLGVGVGVGLGFASGQQIGLWAAPPSANSSAGATAERIEMELMRQVADGRSSKVTFEDFPYKLGEQTRMVLTGSAYVHLKQEHIAMHTRNLAPASRTILLSGPAEPYHQSLAKALAHHFESKLLILDVMDFSLRIQSKYGCPAKDSAFTRSISETTLEKISGLLGSLSFLPQRAEPKGGLHRRSCSVDIRGPESNSSASKLRRNASLSTDISSLPSTSTSTSAATLRRASSWSFDEKALLHALYKVLVTVSKTDPIVLYIRDVENLLYRSERIYAFFNRMLKRLSGPILILGSRTLDPDDDLGQVDENLRFIFPYNIQIKPPEDENNTVGWKSQLEKDMKDIQFQDNRNHIMEVLAKNNLDCDDLNSVCQADTMVISSYIEEIVMSAFSHHLMNTNNPNYRNGKLVISSKSLSHGLSIFQLGNLSYKDILNMEANVDASKESSSASNKGESIKPGAAAAKDGDNSSQPSKATEIVPDNEFEKRIRPEVIPANEIGITFDDIGALDDIKESLQELVMLPLRRPDLFTGGLLKPCRGILLFGPPGTGKTMLAKAIANEAGASFINVSMSTITSKWFGEDEKNVRALFTLAAKVSPTIIFVDEVDSMLGQRTRVGEHEAMRKIKNEFMTHWDGLLTRPGERILVLAATNRPFDLDEAIIRRFERRIMVGLPSLENREAILKSLLSKEKIDENLDYRELATMTDGYSGSDLKNVCTTAAYRPVREFIQKEKIKEQEKKQGEEGGEKKEGSPEAKKGDEGPTHALRPLNMEDMRLAKNQVAASFASEGCMMSELRQWNEMFGEGGSRKKQQLSYFL